MPSSSSPVAWRRACDQSLRHSRARRIEHQRAAENRDALIWVFGCASLGFALVLLLWLFA